VLKTVTREVRVDVVVTDKKGTYIRDLKKEDFKVWEDNKEQNVNNFTFGADPARPLDQQRHYMVLYFDNSSMELSDQPRAREAAQKFIDANAGPDRVMAVMDFGGATNVEQNFTTDTVKLKAAVNGIHTSAVESNASASNDGGLLGQGMPSIGNAASDFGAYTMLLSLRSVAKNLTAIPGRKSLILFTAGFGLSSERMSELTATIDACNKANVAVYPVDVRGLTTMMSKNVAPAHEGTQSEPRYSLSSLRVASARSATVAQAFVPVRSRVSRGGGLYHVHLKHRLRATLRSRAKKTAQPKSRRLTIELPYKLSTRAPARQTPTSATCAAPSHARRAIPSPGSRSPNVSP